MTLLPRPVLTSSQAPHSSGSKYMLRYLVLIIFNRACTNPLMQCQVQKLVLVVRLPRIKGVLEGLWKSLLMAKHANMVNIMDTTVYVSPMPIRWFPHNDWCRNELSRQRFHTIHKDNFVLTGEDTNRQAEGPSNRATAAAILPVWTLLWFGREASY
jgi:hypothetical protein